MYPNNLWKDLLGVGFLLIFAVIGVAHIVWPHRFMKPYLRSRVQIQLVGLIFAGASLWMLYELLWDKRR
ncbi:MAG TPA: hypothetical protein VH350_05735 [Candidatus Sulfotelmatobacter sp.]|nr:hypothetical protein [Candidatus Sulfotelmatobacter sp.]